MTIMLISSYVSAAVALLTTACTTLTQCLNSVLEGDWPWKDIATTGCELMLRELASRHNNQQAWPDEVDRHSLVVDVSIGPHPVRPHPEQPDYTMVRI